MSKVIAPVVGIVAGLATGALLVGGIAFATGSALSGTLIGALLAAGVATVGQLVTKALGPSYNTAESGTQINIAQGPAEPREYVYGKRRTGGTVALIDTTGTDNDTLWIVTVVASHEINAFTKYFIDEKEVTVSGGSVTTSPYNGFVDVTTYTGTSSQTADATLVSALTKWTTNHRLRGNAYVIWKLTWDQDVFPGGIPNLSVEIEGKKVYDPRLDTTEGGSGSHREDDPSTWEYSSNPVLCALDYMRDNMESYPVLGPGIPWAAFTASNVQSAANTCDESVSVVGGGSINRYECHGVVNSELPHAEIISLFEKSMAGNIAYSGGTFRFHPGEWVASSVSLDEDDILSISVTPAPSRKDLVNAVKGLFIDPNQDYQPADYPPKTDSTAETEDGGERFWLDLDLPFTVDHRMAQRIAKIAFERNRRRMAVTVRANLKALDLRVMDVVDITHGNWSWTNKTFRVEEWRMGVTGDDAFAIDMVLQEEDSTVYSWTAGTDEQTYGTPTGPTFFSPFGIDIPTLSGFALTSVPFVGTDGASVPGLKLAYSAPGAWVQQVEAQYKLNSESATAYRPLPAQAVVGTNQITFPAVPESWDARARVLTPFGTWSDWVSDTATAVSASDNIAPISSIQGLPQNIVNLIRDPFMEGADSDIFGTLDGQHNTEADTISVYPNMLRMTADSSNNNSNFLSFTEYTPVEPGEILFFQYALRRNASVNATPASAGIYFQYVDKDKGSATASLHTQDRDDVTTGSWTSFSGQDTVPSGKYYVRVYATNRSDHTAGAFFLANPIVYRATGTANLVDLAVTTGKLGNNAVTNTKMGSNSVDKGEIITNATSLTSFAEKTSAQSMSLSTSWQDVSSLSFTNLTTEGSPAELVISVALAMTMSSRDPDTFQVDVRVVRGATPTEVVQFPGFAGKPAIDITDAAEPEPWYAHAAPSLSASSPGTTEDWKVQARLQNPVGGSINYPDDWYVRRGSLTIVELMKG